MVKADDPVTLQVMVSPASASVALKGLPTLPVAFSAMAKSVGRAPITGAWLDWALAWSGSEYSATTAKAAMAKSKAMAPTLSQPKTVNLFQVIDVADDVADCILLLTISRPDEIWTPDNGLLSESR